MGSTKSDSRPTRDFSGLDVLIADARAGSAAALDRLIERLAVDLWHELGGRRKPRALGSSKGLSDLIQDTLVRVRQKFCKFERETFADFKQWARAVMYKRRQEWIRNFQARNSMETKEKIWHALQYRTAGGDSSRKDIAQHLEETARAEAVFGLLKPNERFIVNLRLLEGLRYKQISEMTGWSEEAARKAFDRAIASLSKLFEAHGQP